MGGLGLGLAFAVGVCVGTSCGLAVAVGDGATRVGVTVVCGPVGASARGTPGWQALVSNATASARRAPRTCRYALSRFKNVAILW